MKKDIQLKKIIKNNLNVVCMARILLIEKKMFCEKHQEYLKEYKDVAGKPFWICLTCDMQEELQELNEAKK